MGVLSQITLPFFKWPKLLFFVQHRRRKARDLFKSLLCSQAHCSHLVPCAWCMQQVYNVYNIGAVVFSPFLSFLPLSLLFCSSFTIRCAADLRCADGYFDRPLPPPLFWLRHWLQTQLLLFHLVFLTAWRSRSEEGVAEDPRDWKRGQWWPLWRWWR